MRKLLCLNDLGKMMNIENMDSCNKNVFISYVYIPHITSDHHHFLKIRQIRFNSDIRNLRPKTSGNGYSEFANKSEMANNVRPDGRIEMIVGLPGGATNRSD